MQVYYTYTCICIYIYIYNLYTYIYTHTYVYAFCFWCLECGNVMTRRSFILTGRFFLEEVLEMLEPQRIAKFLHVEVPIRSLGPIELSFTRCVFGEQCRKQQPRRFQTGAREVTGQLEYSRFANWLLQPCSLWCCVAFSLPPWSCSHTKRP